MLQGKIYMQCKTFMNGLNEVIRNTNNQRAANKYQCQLATVAILYSLATKYQVNVPPGPAT
jgi:hypothetical protein